MRGCTASSGPCVSRRLRARPKRRGLPKDQGERCAVADFTYIWTAESWYVAAVFDLYSRRIVG